MNVMDREQVASIKDMYPVGTRIELISMDDPYSPVPAGTKGTVACVDDMGTVHMFWDNGRTLGVIPGEDSFRKLTAEELEAEKKPSLAYLMQSADNKAVRTKIPTEISDMER